LANVVLCNVQFAGVI